MVYEYEKVNYYLNRGLTGLKNIGNTCYMNSIIQCLSNTKDFREYFLENNTIETGFPLEVKKLLNGMWESNCICVPRSFKAVLGIENRIFLGNRQQDAHECLVFILDLLSRDKQIESKIKELFMGKMYTRIESKETNDVSNTYQEFYFLTLDIPNKKDSLNNVDLYDCLDCYTDPELLDSENKYKIEKTNQLVIAQKQSVFWTLPKYLIVHLKRFNNSLLKKTTKANFPIKNLDLSSYMAINCPRGQETLYDLYAISNHTGFTTGGHYYAFCKNNDKWYIFNDSQVQEIAEDKIVTPEAYILFYKRHNV